MNWVCSSSAAGLPDHAGGRQLEGLLVKGTHVVVAQAVEAGVGLLVVDLSRVDGPAHGHHPLYQLLKYAPDNHVLVVGVIAGHEGAHAAHGGHAAHAAVGLDNQGVCAVSGGGHGRAHACRTRAGHQHVHLFIDGQLLLKCNGHWKFPPCFGRRRDLGRDPALS